MFEPKTKPNQKNMKPQVIITETIDKITIKCPYSLTNNRIFKEKGGRWDAVCKQWVFDRTTTTMEMITQLFGDPRQLVIAKVPLDRITEYGKQWQVGGYVVATRYRHNSPVELPIGVQVEKGHWNDTGGNTADPRVTGDKDLSITVVMYESYAMREKLEIIEHDTPPTNPLEYFGDSDLIEELHRRGWPEKTSADKQAFCSV
jgi:hypothetical protein